MRKRILNTPLVVKVPLLDLSGFDGNAAQKKALVQQLRIACQDVGFFYVLGHGIEPALQTRLEEHSAHFFAADEATKMQISMELGGKAWRGYFPVGAELTSGRPDLKEGIYFGQELLPDHPKVKAGTPLHGSNLFPDIPGFRETVLEYMAAVTKLGHTLMRLLSLSLDLDEQYFSRHFTSDPLILFRIFHYPPGPTLSAAEPEPSAGHWGVGEHTDYGLLTILKQDGCGGLQIKSRDLWIEAPPINNAFVCNIGDMLERMTGGLYRSTPHRVRNVSGRDRYSYPLFFDPGFDVEVGLLPNMDVRSDSKAERWDSQSVYDFKGTYGDYILAKVARVFPELKRTISDELE